jgi:hypothetical protein
MWNMGVVVETTKTTGDPLFEYTEKTRNEIKIDIRKKKQN